MLTALLLEKLSYGPKLLMVEKPVPESVGMRPVVFGKGSGI